MTKKLLIMVLSFIVVMTYFSTFVFASETANEEIDLSATCSVNIDYHYNDKVFADEPIEIYRIAAVSKNFIYTPVQEFEGMGISLNGAISKAEWTAIRTTIENYIASENLLPLKVSFTDHEGKVNFQDLEPGMYFISSVCTLKDDIEYRFDSILTSLPNLVEGKPVYSVDINTKADSTESTGGKVKYKVTKLWKDTGKEQLRPDNIEVKIYKDKEIQEVVQLNEANNWYYSWSADVDGSKWSVSESDFFGMYFVTVEQRQNSFILINTHESYTPPGSPVEPDDPDDKDEPENKPSSTPSAKPPADAPTGDTANINLYIFILCFAGVGLIVISIIGKLFLNKENS